MIILPKSAQKLKSPSHFFTYQRYYYRIESTDPVKGFIIDWDDGEDNSPEKSNSQWVNFDKPQMYGVVSHIYTKAGRFFPKVRVKNMNGFVDVESAVAWLFTDGENYLSEHLELYKKK